MAPNSISPAPRWGRGAPRCAPPSCAPVRFAGDVAAEHPASPHRSGSDARGIAAWASHGGAQLLAQRVAMGQRFPFHPL